MDVIQFPTKTAPKADNRTPVQALQTVIDGIESGKTRAQSVVVVWANENPEDVSEYNYIIGGEAGHSSAIGLLEIVKEMLLE